MSKILKVSTGDYIIQVKPTGQILLNADTVTVSGALVLQGTATTVNSTNLNITDNLIQLNYGNIGNGISSTLNYVSGINVNRGTYDDAQIVFDDSPSGADGNFICRTISNNGLSIALANMSVGKLTCSSITGTLVNLTVDLQNSTSGLISISNMDATQYAANVVAGSDNTIPNRKYITSYVAATSGMADVDNLHTTTAKMLAGSSIITASISSTSVATFTSTGFNVNTVTPLSGSELEVDAILTLDNKTAPSATANKTKIYASATIGAGNSGLYFINSTVNDELVAKNRALLLSMLF
jgi:hypothetical protein